MPLVPVTVQMPRPAVLEHRALLDVHLDVGLGVGHAGAGGVEVLDVDAVLGEHLRAARRPHGR